MNARYYSASTGQFTTRDTYLGNISNPATHNLYNYTGNNPINFIDPTGHFGMTYEDSLQYAGGYEDPMDWFADPSTCDPTHDDNGMYQTVETINDTIATGPLTTTDYISYTGITNSDLDDGIDFVFTFFPLTIGVAYVTSKNDYYTMTNSHNINLFFMQYSFTTEATYGNKEQYAIENVISIFGFRSTKESEGIINGRKVAGVAIRDNYYNTPIKVGVVTTVGSVVYVTAGVIMIYLTKPVASPKNSPVSAPQYGY